VSGPLPKIAIIVVGLPYTGKTTLIESLNKSFPGNEIVADRIYLQNVQSEKVGLEHWLGYCPILVKRIKSEIERSNSLCSFIELGIMGRTHRSTICDWLGANGHEVVKLWLRCENMKIIAGRRRARSAETTRAEGNIDISLGGLYERIRSSFEMPDISEGFVEIDTEKDLETCTKAVMELL